MRNVSNRNKGFTLVELIVIILIIAITSTVAIVSYSGVLAKQRLDTDYAVAESLSNQIEGIVLDEAVLDAYADKRNSIITLYWSDEQTFDGNIYVSAETGGTALEPTDVFDSIDFSIYSAINTLLNSENLPKSLSGRGFTLVVNLSSKNPKGYVVVGDSMSIARNNNSDDSDDEFNGYDVPIIPTPGDEGSDDEIEVIGCLPSNYDARGKSTSEFTNKFKNATKIIFTDAQPRRGVNFADCSTQHDMSIVYWNEGTTYYISTRKTGVKVKANVNSHGMFSGLTKLEEIDFTMLDTSEVTDMQAMLYNTTNLKVANFDKLDLRSVKNLSKIFAQTGYSGVLDLTSWTTSDELTTLYQAFYNTPNITEIKFGAGFNTSNVTDMNATFSKSGLKRLDLSMFDTGNVVDMSYTFKELNNLDELIVANLDVRNVEKFYFTFNNCALKDLDLSGWETASAVNMAGMFKGCSNLVNLYIPKFTITNVTDNGFTEVFYGCSSITSLDLSNLGIPYGKTEPVELKITSLGSAFRDCSKLVHIDFTNFNPVNIVSLSNTFNLSIHLDKETYKFIENWELRNIQNLSYTFAAYPSWRTNVETLDLSKWSGYITDMTGFFQNNQGGNCPLTKIDFGENIKFDNCTSFNAAFTQCVNMKEYDFSRNGNTSKCTNFASMFSSNGKLERIVGHQQFFDFSSALGITSMFGGCWSLEELQLGGCPVNSNSLNAIAGAFFGCCKLRNETFSIPDFNTKNVTSFNNLFSNCSSLKKIDTSWIEWDSANTTTNMFDNCKALVNLEISGISSANNLKNIGGMFKRCYSLEQLDISGLKTDNVTDMSYLFSCCKSLKELDLRNFNTEKVTIMTAMFGGCYSVSHASTDDVDVMGLEHIYVSDKFITRNVKTSTKMFYRCKYLPNFKSDAVDLTKALDSSLGGYLN